MSADLFHSREVTASYLPVDEVTDTWRIMLRVVVPAAAGDLLEVNARARVTNDCGYTIGVGWHLWAYDADLPAAERVWSRIGASNGDNVTPDRHHMPLCIHDVWEVPAGWPQGHRAVVALRADAHSTACRTGDRLTVDPLGSITVRRTAVAA